MLMLDSVHPLPLSGVNTFDQVNSIEHRLGGNLKQLSSHVKELKVCVHSVLSVLPIQHQSLYSLISTAFHQKNQSSPNQFSHQ